MITIERKQIEGIPVLELVEAERQGEELPLALFLHGVTNQKEKGLEPGYELARQGMRTVIPDAYLHGERRTEAYDGRKEMEFWSIVQASIREIPQIVEHYVRKGLAREDRISVTGLSMGAITTCMALAAYPWIHSAGCLMGSPDPIGFTEWILSSHWVEGFPPIPKEVAQEAMEPFRPYSLKAAPHKLAGRPFYIWHGTDDTSVPFEQMDAFVHEVKGKAYGENVKYEYYEGHGHKVPYEIYQHMAAFIGKAQQGEY